MGSWPSMAPQAADAGQDAAALAVAVLESGSGIAELLAGAGLSPQAARTLDDLVGLVESGAVGAAVVDPELGEQGWPTDIGRAAAERLHGRVPLLLVCRSARDAAVPGGSDRRVRDRRAAAGPSSYG